MKPAHLARKIQPAPGKGFLNGWAANYQLWLMVLPAVIYIAVFCYGPMYGIQLAFRDFDFSKGLTGGDWVGLKYFDQYFNSPMFWPTLRNTFVIAFFSIVLGFPMPILLALVVNSIRGNRRKRLLQTTVYMPYFISTVVLVALLQILLSPTTGLINDLLKTLDLIPADINLLGSPGAFVPVYVISAIWQSCGWNSIIFIAALSSVDTQQYDAARIDGANRWKIVWHVEIPAILPTIIILLIMNMGGVLSVGFEKTFLMQNSLNKSVSEVISTYVFNVGVKSNQFSFGSAVGLFNTLVNFLFLILANTFAKKKSNISLM
ncbi:sugar ABC transporter permease [Paenibacillus sp. 19GGS1-52]|uniref:ABC transporter permease n=1 Tax=Paenibacillus sp. 19GGS1-52 TaxID=2758563 RepID=UPI001EFB0C8E|nr:ABC transporter permease subunit [Paenibacillus sp. 19GGS1-52]ULO09016.1 sugar ABC transporter permease [Paenibacillus sp. 19GGS1-52]